MIAEDEALLREGLTLLLAGAGLDVVATAATADELVARVDEHVPDVVLTDIRMPPGHGDDGLRAAVRIRERHPGVGVMVLSQFVQRRYALELLGDNSAGVGYLLKQRIADVERFLADVRRVGNGETVLDPEVVDVMIDRAHRSTPRLEQLTARQLQVLALIAEGRTNTAIATRLGITEKAVVQHASNIYSELGLVGGEDDHRRVLAVITYLSR